MDQLKLLQLNSVKFEQFTEDFAEDLRCLSWIGFDELTMPSHLCMVNMVALDMSYSCLIELEPPMVLQSLKILNLKSCRYLKEVRNISRLPNLETLILWNCHGLVGVCKTIKDLARLTLLNMSGCEHLQYSFSFPCSLERVFLKDCNLECTDDFPLSFSDQPALQYLNLGSSNFERLPTYSHLKSLRVLDLSFCSMLRYLLSLPSTLAELYIYYCTSLEKVSFESGGFTLQEFGYEGCSNLSEIEGFIKLVPLAKLEEADLGYLKWLKEYESHELCLAGDDELMKGRSCHLQMLYEFNIRSVSLPEVKDPNMMHDHISKSMSLTFKVPLCPKNKRLNGLNVYFKYTRSGDDWVWFAKIKTTNGVDLMYNPKVFGKPKFGVVSVWLSYWPIGNKLNVGDSVDVSIDIKKGLELDECGASLVYADVDDVAYEALQNNKEWIDILGGDVSRFQLSTGAYYLCRRDFFVLMEVGRLTPGWLTTLVGDSIDDTEVRGWRKTGRPQQSYQSFVELRTVKCIVYGPQSEDIYKIAEMYKSSFVDKSVEFTMSLLEGTLKSSSTFSDAATEGLLDQPPIASSSSSILDYSWDVYLSLKEFDDDYFGDYLRDALYRARLMISPAFSIQPVRIGQARASIIILSESYLSSSRHLDELLEILGERRNTGHFVLPVFYHLEPSYIIEHRKDFFFQWFELLSKESLKKVKWWYAALMEVANMPNIYFSRWSRNDDDTTSIREIVGILEHALNRTSSPPNPTEKDTPGEKTK